MRIFTRKKTADIDSIKSEHKAFEDKLLHAQADAQVLLRKIALDAEERVAHLKKHAGVHSDAAQSLTEKFL